MKKLTEKQEAVVTFIGGYMAAHGEAPTLREIAAEFSVSRQAVSYALAAIEKKGYIAKSRRKNRSVRILKKVGG